MIKDSDDYLLDEDEEAQEFNHYDSDDLENGFSISSVEVEEIFESLLEDLTEEQLEELVAKLINHISG